MGGSLLEYLRMKVHPDIQNRSWTEILVKGEHKRTSSGVNISSLEKRDKLFNWQRPTTTQIGSKTLQLLCFPGVDYVQHYAAITATYLSLTKRDPDIVRYVNPSQRQRLEPILGSNLRKMGPVDIVIMGYVHGLQRWSQGGWEGGDNDELFAWKKLQSPNGHRIALLGCRVSFWGDIAGNVVRVLQKLNKVSCVLYVGKLGSLRAEHSPNQWLATGCQSLVHSEMVQWENPLGPLVQDNASVVQGLHCTLGSVLNETKEWLKEHRRKYYDFVDPEIGHMARASVDGGTQFGYLHIISDNLAMKYTHDLSNERVNIVLQNRKKLVEEIEDILGQFFEQWDPR
ncbi:Nucleoside phosphorylase domain [Lasallia pustulata]|uniref:Nucleoside phosphorylase domain n=1 Tax=Lasallia pustulata TaxID=136370 RepID=A0A1W5CXU2_9LECA|nr:Nucleoside phosphorylase domain [Lasallia pustulata]